MTAIRTDSATGLVPAPEIEASPLLVRLTGWNRAGMQWLVIGLNVAVAIALLFLVRGWRTSLAPYHIDLDVYRIGGRAWLDGRPLYGALPRTRHGSALPFTYPPIAAVLFASLAIVPYAAAAAAMTTATVVCFGFGLRFFAVHLDRRDRTRAIRVVSAIGPGALPYAEPIRHTIGFGQINAMLMALVIADCLCVRPRWPRGILVGLAAAVKLTPLIFVLYFVLHRDRRGAITAAVSFAGISLLGFALAPADSLAYWPSVFNAGRVGGVDYAGNQSITGVLARLDVHGSTRTAWWFIASALVVVIGVVGIRRAAAAHDRPLGLIITALIGLLISPISWSHHWVWFGPVIVYLVASRSSLTTRVRILFAVFGVLAVTVAPQWRLPNTGDRELRWSAWEQVIGSSYVVYALAFLIAVAYTRASATPTTHVDPKESGQTYGAVWLKRRPLGSRWLG